MSFPNTPSAGTTHTIGDITWEWNGYAWEVIVSTIAGLSGPAGATGNTGPTGVGISGASLSNHELIITYTNGITQNIGYIRGDTGAPGTAGMIGPTGNTGNTGIGISGASLSNYQLILTLTNGTTLNVGYIRGETGPTGADGVGGGASAGVSTLNGLSGGVTLQAGTGISISAGSGGITIGTQDIFVRNDGDSMTGALTISPAASASTTALSVSTTHTANTPNIYPFSARISQTLGPTSSSQAQTAILSTVANGTPIASGITLGNVFGISNETLFWGISQDGPVGLVRGIYSIAGILTSTSNSAASVNNASGIYASALARYGGTAIGFGSSVFGIDVVSIAGGWTATNASGIRVQNPGSGATATNNYGIDILSQTKGTSVNYGIRIAAPSGAGRNAAINFSDTTGTAAGGLLFGTDTNLYRSGSSTLKTDNNLVVTGTITGSNLSGTNTGDQTFFGGTAISVVTGPAGITISYTGVAGAGNTGPTGPSPGLLYNNVDPTTISSGQLAFNNANNPTLLTVASVDARGTTANSYLQQFYASTNSVKGYVQISGANQTLSNTYSVTGGTFLASDIFGNADRYQFNITAVATGGTFTQGNQVYLWFTRSGDIGPTGADGAGGGGGAAGTKTFAIFTPLDNEPPATDFATIDTVNSISVLDFQGTTQESAVFRSMIPEGASFSNLLATLYFTASTVTGGVVWGVQWEKLTGGGISGDRFTGGVTGLATLSGATSTPVGITLSSSSYDGLTSGDPYRVKIYRDAANAADGMGGDAELLIVEIRGA